MNKDTGVPLSSSIKGRTAAGRPSLHNVIVGTTRINTSDRNVIVTTRNKMGTHEPLVVGDTYGNTACVAFLISRRAGPILNVLGAFAPPRSNTIPTGLSPKNDSILSIQVAILVLPSSRNALFPFYTGAVRLKVFLSFITTLVTQVKQVGDRKTIPKAGIAATKGVPVPPATATFMNSDTRVIHERNTCRPYAKVVPLFPLGLRSGLDPTFSTTSFIHTV